MKIEHPEETILSVPLSFKLSLSFPSLCNTSYFWAQCGSKTSHLVRIPNNLHKQLRTRENTERFIWFSESPTSTDQRDFIHSYVGRSRATTLAPKKNLVQLPMESVYGVANSMESSG